jgi:hypothetical protein
MEAPETLVRFIQALAEDEDLQLWFESLADVSERERAGEFRQMAARMEASGEHAELAHTIGLLAAPGIYEAVRTALAELLDE